MPEIDRVVINTGPLIALVAAWGEAHSFSVQNAIQRMKDRGIWLSERVVTFALEQAGEQPL